MNAKLILKTLLMIVVVLLLVMIGLNNRAPVPFTLPPLLPQTIKQPAALMYIIFFAIGMLTGTLLTAGGGKKGSGGSGKPPKAGK